MRIQRNEFLSYNITKFDRVSLLVREELREALREKGSRVRDEKGVGRVEERAVERFDGGKARRVVLFGSCGGGGRGRRRGRGVVFGESDGEEGGELLLLVVESLHRLRRSCISLLHFLRLPLSCTTGAARISSEKPRRPLLLSGIFYFLYVKGKCIFFFFFSFFR